MREERNREIRQLTFDRLRVADYGQGPFGRVMATVVSCDEQRHYSALGAMAQLGCDGANSPLRRRFSPRNPTSPSALLRTRLTMTASFSRPWNPSTLPSSMPGKTSFSWESRASYGEPPKVSMQFCL